MTTQSTGAPAARQIRFNAFEMNCVAHQSPGLWRHPQDRSRDYNTLGYWTHLAKVLESGGFDAVFIADVLGTYDVYGGTSEQALRSGAQVPVNDPALLVSAMAAVTEHLGFGVTAGTAYEHPYAFSRRLATLDHLTGGRVGWNVVTGYLPSAARNMGHTDQREHDARYDHAEEYLEVVYKLLQHSWDDDAVVADREAGLFTDPAKVHDIAHSGEHFTVPGHAITEPSPQRVPVIFQAGASERGRRFAGTHAEATFVAVPTAEMAARTVGQLREAAEAAGRRRDDVAVFAMQTVVTAETDEAAWEKFHDLAQYVDPAGALVLLSGWMGVDLSTYDLDKPVGDVESNAIQSLAGAFKQASGSTSQWTLRELAQWVGVGGFGPVIVGSGETVADELIRWQDEADVDGFNLAYHISPGTFEDIVEHVVPVLRARGRYKTEYTPGTLRHKLFGAGDRLPERHPAQQVSLPAAAGEPAHA